MDSEISLFAIAIAIGYSISFLRIDTQHRKSKTWHGRRREKEGPPAKRLGSRTIGPFVKRR